MLEKQDGQSDELNVNEVPAILRIEDDATAHAIRSGVAALADHGIAKGQEKQVEALLTQLLSIQIETTDSTTT